MTWIAALERVPPWLAREYNADLWAYLGRVYSGLDPACRASAHWVLDEAWLGYCRQLDGVALEHPALGNAGVFLLGLPVQVHTWRIRWPYLEPDPARDPATRRNSSPAARPRWPTPTPSR